MKFSKTQKKKFWKKQILVLIIFLYLYIDSDNIKK